MADPERGVLKLVRIIAVTLLGAGVINVVLYFLECSAHHQPVNPFLVALRTWPAIIGIICLIKSKSLAVWLSDLLDL
jgi:hypothetical protein